MPIRPILAFVCVLSISVAISPSYAGDILYCDGFESDACQASPPPPEPSCVDGIINQYETGFQ